MTGDWDCLVKPGRGDRRLHPVLNDRIRASAGLSVESWASLAQALPVALEEA